MPQNKKIEVYEEKPEEFDARLHIAACYFVINNQFLLLRRSSQESEPGK